MQLLDIDISAPVCSASQELDRRKDILSTEIKKAQQEVHIIDTEIKQCHNVKRMAEAAMENQRRQLSSMSRGERSRVSMFGGERLEEVRVQNKGMR